MSHTYLKYISYHAHSFTTLLLIEISQIKVKEVVFIYENKELQQFIMLKK